MSDQNLNNSHSQTSNPEPAPKFVSSENLQKDGDANLQANKAPKNSENIKTKMETAELKKKEDSMLKGFISIVAILSILILFGLFFYYFRPTQTTTSAPQVIKEIRQEVKVVDEQSAVIEVAKTKTDSVVSIVISKELSNIQRGRNPFFNFDDLFGSDDNGDDSGQNSSRSRRQVGAGTGFLISKEGYIITNRHVVFDTSAEYTVILNDGTSLQAKVLDRDRILDIAFLKVETDKELKPLSLGDSDKIVVGQTSIAIGNSLGEFSNTVSKGIISGLGRTITASDSSGSFVEELDNIIQTDASINSGNSGGPLLDIQGNVIGVNVAKAQNGENIGFAIPINSVKNILDSVITKGKIERPFLGVRYIPVTPQFAKENKLNVDYGVIVSNNNSSGGVIVPNSPADKAGLRLNDIILEVNGVKLNAENSLVDQIQKFKVGDRVKLKIQRGDDQIEKEVVLENYPES